MKRCGLLGTGSLLGMWVLQPSMIMCGKCCSNSLGRKSSHFVFSLQEIRTEIDQATKFPNEKDDEPPDSKKIKLEAADGKLKQ